MSQVTSSDHATRAWSVCCRTFSRISCRPSALWRVSLHTSARWWHCHWLALATGRKRHVPPLISLLCRRAVGVVKCVGGMLGPDIAESRRQYLLGLVGTLQGGTPVSSLAVPCTLEPSAHVPNPRSMRSTAPTGLVAQRNCTSQIHTSSASWAFISPGRSSATQRLFGYRHPPRRRVIHPVAPRHGFSISMSPSHRSSLSLPDDAHPACWAIPLQRHRLLSSAARCPSCFFHSASSSYNFSAISHASHAAACFCSWHCFSNFNFFGLASAFLRCTETARSLFATSGLLIKQDLEPVEVLLLCLEDLRACRPGLFRPTYHCAPDNDMFLDICGPGVLLLRRRHLRTPQCLWTST